jgi:isoleucyl-tRNA synthetase
MFNNLSEDFINLNYVNYFNIDKNYIITVLKEVYNYLQQHNNLSVLLIDTMNNEIDASSKNVVVKVNINNKSYISYKKLYDEINYYLYNNGYLYINNFLYISLYFVSNGFYILGDLYINKLKKHVNNLTKDKVTEIYNKVLNIYQYKTKTLSLDRINGSNKTELLNYYNNTIFQEACEKDYFLGCYYYYFENDVNTSLSYFNTIINNYPYNKSFNISKLYKRLYKYSMINMNKIYLDMYNDKLYFEYETNKLETNKELLELKNMANYYESNL